MALQRVPDGDGVVDGEASTEREADGEFVPLGVPLPELDDDDDELADEDFVDAGVPERDCFVADGVCDNVDVAEVVAGDDADADGDAPTDNDTLALLLVLGVCDAECVRAGVRGADGVCDAEQGVPLSVWISTRAAPPSSPAL